MCCRLRFLRTLPTNAMRMEWLKRWRDQFLSRLCGGELKQFSANLLYFQSVKER